jgi:NitT/TauT family transport system substrate-binding protein
VSPARRGGEEEISVNRTRFLTAVLVVIALLVAACGSGGGGEADTTAAADTTATSDTVETVPTTSPDTTEATESTESPDTTAAAADEIGPPETTELVVGFRFPNATFYLPHLIGTELGYFEEEGLTITELTTAADLGAALQGESIDIAMEWPEAPYYAAESDLPMTIIGGYLCRSRIAVAVQPDVESVEDLDGQAVTLAGTSGDLQENARKNVLAMNGWDLDTVDVEIVYPGPGSDVWRQFFINGQIALMPYFVDDEVPLQEYGANFIVDDVVHAPRGVLTARPDFVEENPNTVARYLRALMRAHQYVLEPGIGEEPANREEMLAMMEAGGFPDPFPEGPWSFDQNNMCPNLHVGEESWELLLELYELEQVPLEDVSMLEPLYQAQESLGLDNSPPVEIEWPPSDQ